MLVTLLQIYALTVVGAGTKHNFGSDFYIYNPNYNSHNYLVLPSFRTIPWSPLSANRLHLIPSKWVTLVIQRSNGMSPPLSRARLLVSVSTWNPNL